MKVFRLCVAAAFLAGALQAQEPAADSQLHLRTGVVIGKADRALMLWTKNGREKFTYTPETTMPLRKIKDGNMVVVYETAKGSNVASRIVLVDDEVVVTGKTTRQRAVVGRVHAGISPGHVIIKTLDGKEAFVIDPRTFRQPLPKPNQRVAVTYRVENVTPPIYKATGIVVLADQIDQSPIKITYADIEQPEAVVVEAPAPMPEPEPAPALILAQLPQTASRMPLIALLGACLVGAGLVTRRMVRSR